MEKDNGTRVFVGGVVGGGLGDCFVGQVGGGGSSADGGEGRSCEGRETGLFEKMTKDHGWRRISPASSDVVQGRSAGLCFVVYVC